jgi:hypothetical protein
MNPISFFIFSSSGFSPTNSAYAEYPTTCQSKVVINCALYAGEKNLSNESLTTFKPDRYLLSSEKYNFFKGGRGGHRIPAISGGNPKGVGGCWVMGFVGFIGFL